MSEPQDTRNLNAAYRSVFNDRTSTPGRRERNLDTLESRADTKANTGNIGFARQFYDANQATIAAAGTSILTMEPAKIDQAISEFGRTARIVMQGLDEIAKIHPFIGVAVVTFKLVVSLDLTRRENNQKVMALRLQMQDMTCTLFRLRNIEHPDVFGPDGVMLKDRLQSHIEQIALDIRECGSACDVYLRKNFLARTLKSKIYEAKLAEYATTFVEHRNSLNDALAVHTVLGVEAANEKLGKQGIMLQSIEGKLDQIFRRLSMAEENDVVKFMNDHGGPGACLDNDELLRTLVHKSGVSLSSFVKGDNQRPQEELVAARNTLTKELAEKVDILIQKNMAVFIGKLDLQSRQLGKIEMQGDYIIATLTMGAHEVIKDRDLQILWKEMEWKGSVKAQHFVLSLCDYYTDQFDAATPLVSARLLDATSLESATQTERSSRSPMTPESPDTGVELEMATASDRWALQFIDPRNTRAIIEAIDEDGTGFITIKEANMFAVGRPKNWTLLHWLAFWAEGWNTSLDIYRKRIYSIVGEMHHKLDSLLSCNRLVAEQYLHNDAFSSIEHLLRAFKRQESTSFSPEFQPLIDEYMESEERRLKHNLETIKYVIDSSATVSLVVGRGRVEKSVFPLLYLVLNRHLQVFKYSKKHVLPADEFSSLGHSLCSIFELVFQRISDLQAIARHVQRDPSTYFEDFSFGMFSLLSSLRGEEDSRDLKGSTLLESYYYLYESICSEFDDKQDEALPISAVDPSLDTFHFDWSNMMPPPPDEYSADWESPGGIWTGYLIEGDAKSGGLYQLRLQYMPNKPAGPDDDAYLEQGTIDGEGVSSSDLSTVTGRYRVASDGKTEVDMIVTYPDARLVPRRLIGTFDVSVQMISGSFVLHDTYEVEEDITWFNELPAEDDLEKENVFLFRRIPGEVYRYHYNIDSQELKEPPARALWAFFQQAVLFYARRRMWSWKLIRQWGEERREYMGLYERSCYTRERYAIKPFSDEEGKKVSDKDRKLSPVHSYLHRKLVTWRREHMTYHFYHDCDLCGRNLLLERYICLSCTSPGLCYTVDFCQDCVDAGFDPDSDTHSTSHTIFKVGSFLLPHQKRRVFAKAKGLSIRLKDTTRRSIEEQDESYEGEGKPGEGKLGEGDSSRRKINGLSCDSCGKEDVYLPFWACLSCRYEVFLCNDCYGKEIPIEEIWWGESHTTSHHLLRIHTISEESDAPEKVDPTICRIDSLESKVNDRLGSMEERILKLEQKHHEHGDLLKRIIALLEGSSSLTATGSASAAKTESKGTVPEGYAGHEKERKGVEAVN